MRADSPVHAGRAAAMLRHGVESVGLARGADRACVEAYAAEALSSHAAASLRTSHGNAEQGTRRLGLPLVVVRRACS